MPSRPVLIGRGLVTHQNTKARAKKQKLASTIQNLNQQTHPQTPTGNNVGNPGGTGSCDNTIKVHHVTAAIATGKHPDPSRTRKLSQPAPMVLQPRGCGRVGRRRTNTPVEATPPGGLYCICGPFPGRLPSTAVADAGVLHRLLRDFLSGVGADRFRGPRR